MHAVTIKDKQLSVEEHPDPVPGAGEVLVRVRAAGLNGADMHQLRGGYPAPPGLAAGHPRPRARGRRGGAGPGAMRFDAGRARDVDRRRRRPGRARRCPRADPDGGPERLSWTEAGGTPEVFTTAHDALFTQAGLRAGERLLVHGGAGGVGTAAVQLGLAAGARVTATVRNPDLRERRRRRWARMWSTPQGFAEHGPL